MKTVFVSLSSHAGELVLDSYTGKDGCYVCVLPNEQSKEALANLAKAIGNDKYEETKEKLHTTVMYSEKALDTVPRFLEQNYEGVCSEVKHLVGHDGDVYIYAAVDCPALNALHNRFIKHGAVPSFPDYNCHVTLDKYSAEEWKEAEKQVAEKMAEVNSQLEESRLVVSYDSVRIANLKG